MEKQLLPLEERIRKLEEEVERLRKMFEAHMKDHDFPPPIHPSKPGPPSKPFDPKHPDVGPPREF
ncbi:MAG: hypothetical protein ACFFDS_00385 [Candidatus Thorarchaeota archaeon]